MTDPQDFLHAMDALHWAEVFGQIEECEGSHQDYLVKAISHIVNMDDADAEPLLTRAIALDVTECLG